MTEPRVQDCLKMPFLNPGVLNPSCSQLVKFLLTSTKIFRPPFFWEQDLLRPFFFGGGDEEFWGAKSFGSQNFWTTLFFIKFFFDKMFHKWFFFWTEYFKFQPLINHSSRLTVSAVAQPQLAAFWNFFPKLFFTWVIPWQAGAP